MLPGMGMGLLQAGVGAAQAISGMIGMGKKKRAAEASVDAIGTYRPSQEIAGIYEGAKLRSTTGLGGASKQLAQQGIARASSAAMGRAQDRKAGLAMIGAAQAQEQQGALQLAAQDEAARERSQARLTQAAGMQASEKEKAFKSAQDKQQLKANIALQELAAKRQAVSQGLSGIAGGLGTAATAGMFGGGAGKQGLFGMFTGKNIRAKQINQGISAGQAKFGKLAEQENPLMPPSGY